MTSQECKLPSGDLPAESLDFMGLGELPDGHFEGSETSERESNRPGHVKPNICKQILRTFLDTDRERQHITEFIPQGKKNEIEVKILKTSRFLANFLVACLCPSYVLNYFQKEEK